MRTMIFHLFTLLSISTTALGIQCNFHPGKFFCEGTDEYDFIYHFHMHVNPSPYGNENYEIQIVNSNYSVIDTIVNLPLQHGTAIITKLAIRNSSVSYVKEHALESLDQLNDLDLSCNKISELTFVLPRNLEYLNLSHNYLKTIDFSVLAMNHIDFSYNLVSELRPSYRERTFLHANLSNNKISEFDEVKLKCSFNSLDLSANTLKNIVLKRFSDPDCKINLSYNRINSIMSKDLRVENLDITHSIFISPHEYFDIFVDTLWITDILTMKDNIIPVLNKATDRKSVV